MRRLLVLLSAAIVVAALAARRRRDPVPAHVHRWGSFGDWTGHPDPNYPPPPTIRCSCGEYREPEDGVPADPYPWRILGGAG